MNKTTKLKLFTLLNIIEILIEVTLYYLGVAVVPDYIKFMGVPLFVLARIACWGVIALLIPKFLKIRLLGRPVAEIVTDLFNVGLTFFTLANGGYIIAQLVS